MAHGTFSFLSRIGNEGISDSKKDEQKELFFVCVRLVRAQGESKQGRNTKIEKDMNKQPRQKLALRER